PPQPLPFDSSLVHVHAFKPGHTRRDAKVLTTRQSALRGGAALDLWVRVAAYIRLADPERWLSGRKRLIRNQVWAQVQRGFDSHPPLRRRTGELRGQCQFFERVADGDGGAG